jgi:aminoglycoside 9-adenylyltransferase
MHRRTASQRWAQSARREVTPRRRAERRGRVVTRSPDVPEQAHEAVQVVQDALGDSMAGAYLYGSAVMGGLRPSSDVDVLVIVEQAVLGRERHRIVEGLLRMSGRGDGTRRPLEVTIVRRGDVVPWRYPPAYQLVYGEWLRASFEAGRVPGPITDPDLAIVLAKARGHGVPLVGPGASALLEAVPATDLRRAMRDSLPRLVAGVRGDERNVLLTLARMWRTAVEGDVVSKDVAAAWAAARLEAETGALLEVARRGYRGEREDVWVGTDAAVDALVATLRLAVEAGLVDVATPRRDSVRSPKPG